MKKIAPLVVTGALLASCGGETTSVPSEVIEVFESTAEQYPCDKTDVASAVLTLSEIEPGDLEPGRYYGAYTDDLGVTFEASSTLEEQIKSAPHEYIHWRVDMSKITYLDNPVEIEGEGKVVGSRGFRISFDASTVENPDEFTMLEEGIAEWLVSQPDDPSTYSQDSSYLAVNTLTYRAMQYRGITKDEVAERHCESDILWLISKLKDTPIEKLDGNDFYDVIMLYQNAYMSGVAPDEVTIKLFLDIF